MASTRFKGNLVESVKLVYNCFIEQKKKKGKLFLAVALMVVF
jgi:hypothetical protein